jgi:hypothetical protein
MNRRIRFQLQEALKNRPDLQISEEHLTKTVEAARIAYQSRRRGRRIRYPAFLLRQVRFIGAPAWLLQGAALLSIFLCWNFFFKGDFGYIKSRHLPPLLGCSAVVIAMPGIPFIGRSVKYRMLEIEMAARLSFRSLLLARILIVGAGSVPALGTVFLLASAATGLTTGGALIYLSLPYLLVSCGGILIQLRARGQAADFIYAALCVFFIALLFTLYKVFPQIYEQALLGVWRTLCAVFAAVFAVGLHCLLKKANALHLPAAEA